MRVNAEEKLTTLIELVSGFVDAARVQLVQENDFGAKVEQLNKKIDAQEQVINQLSSKIQELKEYVNVLSTNLEILINEFSIEDDEEQEALSHHTDKHHVDSSKKTIETNYLSSHGEKEDEEYEGTYIETDEEIKQFQEDMFQLVGKPN